MDLKKLTDMEELTGMEDSSEQKREKITFRESVRILDVWVEEQIETNGFEKGNQEDIIFLPIQGLKIQGTIQFNDNEDPLNVLTITPTPGGGSCLIHSFLTALSLSYCLLKPNEKVIIGNRFRELLSTEPFFSEEERELLADPTQNLTQQMGEKIAEYLYISVYFISPYGIDRPQVFDENKEIVMILNNNGHYDAVAFPEYLDTPESRLNFYNSIDSIEIIDDLEEDEDGGYIDELPDIDLMKSQLLEIGMIEEGDNDEYIRQQYRSVFLGGANKRNNLSRKKRKNTKGRKITKRRKNTKRKNTKRKNTKRKNTKRIRRNGF